ncbi:ABC transporter permease [Paenibacillus sp. MSJ-34]|uniref:ABC transporter permease n=1 Tax=Paenibacillus sp. MSJ-34 TaxID=2841529 RepID=UPI001C0FB4B8|nr:ABC transporter permease [Paenibacillus sp. MSJ-34]MBU5443161.1 ABC transporter permease [Paenibacillus sp. MSJ-34]
MNNAQKALVMAAGIFLAIALITIAVVLFISAQEATKSAQNNFSNIQTELSQTAFTVYDNTVVSGSQVINALRKYSDKDQFGIRVVTGKNRAGAWYGKVLKTNVGVESPEYGSITDIEPDGRLAFATDEAQIDYVNPSGKFQANIVQDSSNVIRGIIFVQK